MENFMKINRRELIRLTGMGSLAAASTTIPGISNFMAVSLMCYSCFMAVL